MKKFYKGYYLIKSHYVTDDEAIALYLENEFDTWGDITINLPGVHLGENNVAINGDIPDDTIREFEKRKLFKVIGEINYNYGRYKIAHLNLDTIAKYSTPIDNVRTGLPGPGILNALYNLCKGAK